MPAFRLWCLFVGLCVIALVGSGVALAREAAPGSDAEDVAPERLSEAPIVVTAARAPETADQSLSSVSVVTGEELARLQVNSLIEGLRGLPGAAIVNQGGRGKATTLFLRGASARHLLVLVDGVRVGSATLGLADLQQLPVDEVQRVEVVRGPRASLYGSSAVGGVIQIFTRNATPGDLRPHARLTGGSRGLVDAAAGLGVRGDAGWLDLSASRRSDVGFDATDGGEPDRDGYRNLGASLRLGREFGLARVEGRLLHSDSEVEFDGGWVNESEGRMTVYSVQVDVEPTARWGARLNAGQSHHELDSFRDSVFRSTFITRRDEFSVQNDIQLVQGVQLLLAGDYTRDRVSGTTGYAVKKRNNRALVAQLLGDLGAHRLQIAGHYTDNEQFGGQGTGNLAWGWRLKEQLMLTLSWGTAFSAPTFNDLYFPGYGNPDLAPEESEEFGIRLSGGGLNLGWSLGAWRNDIENLIEPVLVDPATFTYQAQNLSAVRLEGIEGEIETRLAGFDLRGYASLLNPRDRADDARLRRRPRHVLRLDLDRPFGSVTAGISVLAEGSRYEDAANAHRVAAFATLDLRVRQAFNDAWSLSGRVENLFDKRYQTVPGYRQPGRGFFVTLRYQP